MTSLASSPPSVGILGADRVGTAIARQALTAGLSVKIATAKPAEEIALLVEVVAPGAVAVDAAEAVSADLVVLAVPLPRYRTLDPELLAGKTVIDVMNHWAPTDGEIVEFENDPRTSSEIIQAFLHRSTVVKSLNHIGYHELEEDDLPPGTPGRRALTVAGDDEHAVALFAGFLDRLGFDPVPAGPLAAGRAFQPGTEIFHGSHTAEELHGLLGAAQLTHA